MSPRTLHRRLAVEGTSWKKLLDDVRYERARQLLQDSDSSITEIALDLGYSDHAAFTRAFRRWAGSPPSQHRRHAA
jgi:AraC-like DNA-binding protein